MRAAQASFEDLGTPLSEVTFACVDLETTGGAPPAARITEIGAVKYRGGERVGAFQTLVDPGIPIPRFITHLTGIDDLEVRGAPSIEAVLPALAEFLRGTVFVAHNAPFDHRFLAHDLRRLGYDPPPSPPVCTAKLARRLLGSDVANVRLATLADHFRTTRPTHRALDDARACADVLHALLELGGRMGILTLGDLEGSVRARGRPHYAKIRLTDALPTGPGIYLFRRAATPAGPGEVLYVGKAGNIRSRVRSYFYGDGRRKVADLLAETGAVEAIPCPTEIEALVREARLIRRHAPRYNRRGTTWRRYAYVKLDLREAWPRLKIVHDPRGEGTFLGPLTSAARARMVKEALEEAFPIRRCTDRMGRTTRFTACALADLGRCVAPCEGRIDPEGYEGLVRSLQHALSSPGELLAALEDRMHRLARAERFEEAAVARERLRALVEALSRDRAARWMVGAGDLEISHAERIVRFRSGALATRGDETGFTLPLAREAADEVRAACSVLARQPGRVLSAERAPAEPVDGGATLARLRALLRAEARAGG